MVQVHQTAASILGLGVSVTVYRPFKSGVSVSYSPLAVLELSHADFQSQTLWELAFLVQILSVGSAQSGA